MKDLERALPDPTPTPGARERVRAGIPRRVERMRRRRTIAGYGVVITAAAVAVAAMSVLGARDTPTLVAGGAPLGAGVLELPSQARVLISPGTITSLVRDDEAGTIVRVERGTILASVEKRPSDRPFVVLARELRVEVVGTTFAVGVDPDGTVGVRGYEGSVRVIGPGTDRRVGAGEAWPTAAHAPVVDDAALAKLAPVGRVASLPPPPAPSLEPPPDAAEPPRDGASPPPVAVDGVPRAPTPPVGAYTAAKQLEEAGDLKQALAAYQAIRTGKRAEDALYAAGRLQHGVLHDPDAALVTFTAYRTQYPRGRYARAVDVHLLDLAMTRGDHETMEREANAFLAQHADDPVASRFRLARASARIRRGDCAGALADLAQLPDSPAATKLRARCAP